MRLRAWQHFLKAMSLEPSRRRQRAAVIGECLERRIVPAVNVTNGANFAVSITGSESVEIAANGDGKVVVRVNGVDAVQTTDAADVTSLTVTASGSFNNRIDLQGVTASDFGSLSDISVNGGSGNDLLIGSELADTLNGSNGNDTLLGLGADDSLIGGNNNDVLIGGADNDQLTGGSGNDTLSGEGGNDTCLGGDGADKISGGDDNDNVNGQAGNDSLTGDAGDDYVFGGAGVDTLSGGDGNDMIKGQGGKDVIEGSQDDVLAEAQAFKDAFLLANPAPAGTPQLPNDASNEYRPTLVFSTSFVPNPDDFLLI